MCPPIQLLFKRVKKYRSLTIVYYVISAEKWQFLTSDKYSLYDLVMIDKVKQVIFTPAEQLSM